MYILEVWSFFKSRNIYHVINVYPAGQKTKRQTVRENASICMSLIDYWNQQQNDSTVLGQFHNVLKAMFITKHGVQAVDFISASCFCHSLPLSHTKFSAFRQSLWWWERIDWTWWSLQILNLNNLEPSCEFGFQSSWVFRSLLSDYCPFVFINIFATSHCQRKNSGVDGLLIWPCTSVLRASGALRRRWVTQLYRSLGRSRLELKMLSFPLCKAEDVPHFGHHIDVSFLQGHSS